MPQGLIITCTSTPTAIAGTGTHGVIRVRLKALSGTAYFGDSGVTTGGYPLSTADAAINEVIYVGETLWAASSSGGAPTVAVLRTNDTT